MTNLIACIGGFTFLAYLLGYKHGKQEAERKAQTVADALRHAHVAREGQVLQAYAALRGRCEHFKQRYLSAAERLVRHQRRVRHAGRN